MLTMKRSAFKRKPRSDKGKPRNTQFTLEYRAYLCRCNRMRTKPVSEPEYLQAMLTPCDLCGGVAGFLEHSRPYCLTCLHMMSWLGGEAVALDWARRVAAYR